MCIALSVAELCSAYPTSGALYFSCKYLVPEKYIAEVGWICGWMNLLGQIAGTASTDYGAAQLLLAAVSIGSDFTYFPTPGHTVAVSIAIITFHGLVNTASTKWLERITRYYVFYHIGVLVACCISLLVLQKNKHSGEYVFTNVEPASGWTPTGFSFLFGFLSASWTMTDYDATAHIAEEIKDAAIKTPWAIASALGFTYVAGFLFTIVLCFCMGEPADILDSPIGQPVAQVFYNVLGKSASIFFIVSAVIVLTFTSNAGIQAGSRTMWAFSRDEMLPFSRVWYKLNTFTGTPLNAVWCYTLICILINLIGLGSYTAVSAIFNVCAIAMDWSYCIPILAKLIWGRMEPGPWHLGPASKVINVCAVGWTAFVSIIFMFPTFMPVTKDNMNYASVIFVAIALFALGYWYLAGKRYYHGPRTRIMVINGMSEELDPSHLRTE